MKNTIDKIVMDETKKEEIRKELLKKRTKSHTWVKVAASVAAVVAALMIVPFTRNSILSAAEKVANSFKSKGGQQIEIVMDDNGDFISAMLQGEQKGFTEVKDGRLYFVLDDESIDITDLCSESEFYRYEIKNDDGSYNLIYVGGTVDNPGWIEFIISPDFIKNTETPTPVVAIVHSENTSADDPRSEWEAKALEDGGAFVSEVFGTEVSTEE